MSFIDKAPVSLSLFVIGQCRKFGLFWNENTTVMSHGDELQVMQFCLASHNKENKGELEADSSNVVMLVDHVKKSAIQDIENILKDAHSKETGIGSSAAAGSLDLVASGHDCSLGVAAEPLADGHNSSFDVVNKAVSNCDANTFNERSLSEECDAESDKQDDGEAVTKVWAPGRSSMKEADVLELFHDYKATNNHWTVMDVHSAFTKAAVDPGSGLHQSMSTNSKDINKLEADLDGCGRDMQTKIIRYLQTICSISMETRTPLDKQETGDLLGTSSEDVQLPTHQPSPRHQMLMSPKTPGNNTEDCSSCFLPSFSVSVTTPISPSTGRGLKEIFLEDLFRSYLHLLVNSRSQLALARVFNIPERGLDHKAFTCLKHEALACGLSMYQMLSSLMLRIQLGGQGYAPTKNNPLLLYVKGLGSLLDMIQKLQTIIEEVPDPGTACPRLVNIIKNNLIQCKSCKFPRSLVGPVSENIHNILSTIIRETDSRNENSPGKAHGDGGSVMGRPCLRIIRHFLDRTSLSQSQLDLLLMNDIYFTSKSPSCFPCLLTQFRSPSIMDIEDKYKGHIQNMVTDSPVCRPHKTNNHFVSAALYVDGEQQSSELILTQRTLSSIEVLPSETIVHPRSNKDCKSTGSSTFALSDAGRDSNKPCQNKRGKRPTTSSIDKENLLDSLSLETDQKQKPAETRMDAKGRTATPTKRKSGQIKNVKSCRRRLLPQVKGQAKITGFFRM